MLLQVCELSSVGIAENDGGEEVSDRLDGLVDDIRVGVLQELLDDVVPKCDVGLQTSSMSAPLEEERETHVNSGELMVLLHSDEPRDGEDVDDACWMRLVLGKEPRESVDD